MLDILSSPLKSYLAQTLQFYLSKYLKDIHLEGLGFFGSDLVLNDLEIKRHVLQTALDIPSAFDFSRGFIRELRIHIPWTQILSQPIEIKLYTVELILTAKDHAAAHKRRRRNSGGSECSSVTLNTQTSKHLDPDPQTQMDPPKSSWLQSMLSKILANISIQINNLVLKYEQDDIVLSLTLGLLDVYSANEEKDWARGYEEPKGTDKIISKRMDAKDISVFLDRYTSDRLSVDFESDIIHRQVIGYEVPVLRRTNVSLRVQFALEPTAFALTTPACQYAPSQFTDPFRGRAFDGPSLVVVGLFVAELNFSLSDRQVQMLVHVATHSPGRPSGDAADHAKPSPLLRAHSSPLASSSPLEFDVITPSSSAGATLSTAGDEPINSSTPWTSWALGMLVGSSENDELEQEMLQGMAATMPPPPTSNGPIEASPSDESTEEDDKTSTAHLVTVRVSIQRASLTLRCHGDDATTHAPPSYETDCAVEYVPVANMGLVQVAASSHSKTKISKAAEPIATLDAAGCLVVWSTDQAARQDLVVEIENLVAREYRDAESSDVVLRAGTFHASNRRAVVHDNVHRSFFRPLLQDSATWNVHQRHIRRMVKDDDDDVFVYVWQPPGPRDDDDDEIDVGCVCGPVSHTLESIEAVWQSAVRTLVRGCVPKTRSIHDHVLHVLQAQFRWPLSRLAQVDSVVAEFWRDYNDSASAEANVLERLLPRLVAYTAQLANHQCRTRATPSALRVRLVEDSDASSLDISIGPVQVDVTPATIAAGIYFVDRLDFPPPVHPIHSDLTKHDNEVERRLSLWIHAAQATVHLAVDDDSTTLHLTNVMVTTLDTAQEATVAFYVDEGGIVVNAVNVVQAKSVSASFGRDLDVDTMTGISLQASVHELTSRWHARVGRDLLTRLVPRVLDVLGHESLARQFIFLELASTQDTFVGTLEAVAVTCQVSGTDILCAADIGSVTWHRLSSTSKTSARFVHTQTPWLQTKATCAITATDPHASVVVHDILESMGWRRPNEQNRLRRLDRRSVQGVIHVHVAPSEVDWRHCVHLLRVIPPTFPSLDEAEETSALTPSPRAPIDWLDNVERWSFETRVTVAASKWHLTRYLHVSTPRVSLESESASASRKPPSSNGHVGGVNLSVAASEWGVVGPLSTRIAWVHGVTATIQMQHLRHVHGKKHTHAMELDFAVAAKKIEFALAPYHLALLSSVPCVPASPTASDNSTDTSLQASTIAWCVKGGVQVLDIAVDLFAPSLRLALHVRDISTALRCSNYSPLHPIVPHEQVIIDAQLLVHDVAMREEQTLRPTSWLRNTLPTSTLLSILMCLGPEDILTFAHAVSATPPDPATLQNPLVMWQYTTTLARECNATPTPPALAVQPLVCTMEAFAPLTYDTVFLSLFTRNYGTQPQDTCVHGSMEAVDIVFSLPTLRAITHFVDKALVLVPPSSTSSSSDDVSTTMTLPHISFQMEPIRLILPSDTMLCMEGLHVESTPSGDLNIDGLSCPPFTPLRKKARGTRPTTSGFSDQHANVIGRIHNMYVALWTPNGSGVTTGPFETSMARVTGHHVMLSKVDYLVHPFLVSGHVGTSAHATVQLALHATKVTVDLPYERYLNVLGKVHAIVATLPPPRLQSVAPLSKPRDETSFAFGCHIVLDGFELNLTTHSASLHLRVGCFVLNHAVAPSVQGVVSIKNIVVGFRETKAAEETLICGPFVDPTEWQLAVEKYPEKLVSATWTIQDGILSGLVEVQGVQCHLSLAFYKALVPFVVHLVPEDATVGQPTPIHSTPFSLGTNVPMFGLLQQCKIKLLWSPSVATVQSSTRVSAVLTIGSTFASVHVGYDASDVDALTHHGRSILHHYMPLKCMDYMCTVQAVRVHMLKRSMVFRIPIPSKFTRDEWSQCEAQWTQDLHVPVVQEVQLRLTGETKQVVALQPFALDVLQGIQHMDVQIETTPIEGAICFETWTMINALVAEVEAILPAADDLTHDQPTVAAGDDDDYDDRRAHMVSSPPTLNDFTDLHCSSDSSRHHAGPGELVLSDACDPFDASRAMQPMRMSLATRDMTEDMECLVRRVNEPWDTASIDSVVVTLRWKYHLPRRVCRLLTTPLPMPPFDMAANWPRYDASDTISRLCDVSCELRCWDMTQNAYCTLGTFYVPWEPLHVKPGSSFVSALRSWVESEPAENDTIERLLQPTYYTREYMPALKSSQQWELRWRLPRAAHEAGAPVAVISALLAASLRVSSMAEPEDLSGHAITCNIPHVQVTLLRGQETLHEVARVRFTDVSCWMYNLSLLRVAGELSGELQNMVTLSSIPVLPPVQLQLGCRFDAETHIHVSSSPLHLHLSQYALKCLLELPHLFSENPKDLSDMRILVRNGMGTTLYFRQHSTSEQRQLGPYESVVYSWQSVAAPFQLQFALTSALSWSTGCGLNQRGVYYRDCDTMGSYWVDVSSEGIQTIVTLRGSIVLHNYLDRSFHCRLASNPQGDNFSAAPCASLGDCACASASFMARTDANLCVGTLHGDSIVWSNAHALVPGTELLEPATSENVTKATFVSIPHPSHRLYMWLVVKRAVATVLQRGHVPRLARYSWLEVSLWPVLQLYNSLAVPVEIAIVNKATQIAKKKVLDPRMRWVVAEYSPLQQHTLVFSTSSTVALHRFDVPRFVTVDNQDMASYPSSAIQMAVPTAGFISITRHAPVIPTRSIAIQPLYHVVNELPVDVVVEASSTKSSIRVCIPSQTAADIPFPAFLLGVQPHDTLVWSPELAWQDGPQSIHWPFRVDGATDFVVRGVLFCHPASAPCQTQRITIAPRDLLVNTTEWTLGIKPATHGSEVVPVTTLHPQAMWWVWGWDTASLVAPKPSMHSSLQWIRNRLSSNTSSTSHRPDIFTAVSFSIQKESTAKTTKGIDGFQWSVDVPLSSTATTTARRRILVPHVRNHHAMLTMHTTLHDHTVMLSVSRDPQPPLLFQNHLLDRSVGVALDRTPVMVGPEFDLEYDWTLQECVSLASEPSKSPTTASVFDDAAHTDPSVRFRLCDQDHWSNTLWVAEGIQFAKWSDERSTTTVLLVTVYKRAGTWVVRLDCIEGDGISPSLLPRRLPRRSQPHIRVDVAVDQVAVSLLDEHLLTSVMTYREVCRLAVRCLHLSILSSSRVVPETAKTRFHLGYLDHLAGFTTYCLTLQSLDLVHLFPDCNFPVVLSTFATSSSSASSSSPLADQDLVAKDVPTPGALLLRLIQAAPWPQTRALPYLHAVDVAIAPLVVQIEDTLIDKVQLWVAPLQSAFHPKDVYAIQATLPRLRVIVEPKVYIEHLAIREIALTITARALCGLDRTPLTLSAVHLTHVFCAADQLTKDIAANYVADALVHSPMVLMSLNVLGNPAGFFRDVSTGVQDLVRLPLLAVTEEGYTPYSLTKGVVHGTASFFTHASVAALTSVSGIALAVSRSMDHLALAQQPRPQMMPSTFASGLSGGLNSLGRSVLGAATGVVTTPLTLFRENQAQGKDTGKLSSDEDEMRCHAGLGASIVGVGKGLVGIVAQPMSGMASLVSQTSQGLLVEMGFGPTTPTPLQVPITRNDKLHVRWKILSHLNIPGDIQFAPAVYVGDHQDELDSSTSLPPVVVSSWLLLRDVHKSQRDVILIVSPTHVYVVDRDTEAMRCDIPLAHLSAMEQSVLEPTKLDLGIGLPALKMQWHCFRLAPLDRRRLGSVVSRLKKW
ncbi:Aste57867_14876 [Aphanomyces stellatus]|uniref:Aste57867_14876 protein n=1 Tax=Aphanomyces stellatus TaxID=120398 RepID=A0A485L1U1_9STRA|nr:hypothetical protein As57867_014820 [Aphanomyces stellatus]VFT91693.1 Aste57867_14876 [Aphanomyces stellatus]